MRDRDHAGPILLLLGGPAGAGKSTLARAWCAARIRAAHIELDEVRHLIVSGRADPQHPGPLQHEQYALSVRACVSLAREFLSAGYDVALDDALPPPRAFDLTWHPLLNGLDWRPVIVLPSLECVLSRSRQREKRVHERHSRDQHAASLGWPPQHRADTTHLTIGESLALVRVVSGT